MPRRCNLGYFIYGDIVQALLNDFNKAFRVGQSLRRALMRSVDFVQTIQGGVSCYAGRVDLCFGAEIPQMEVFASVPDFRTQFSSSHDGRLPARYKIHNVSTREFFWLGKN